MAGGEVVGAVDDDVGGRGHGRELSVADACRDAHDADLGIDGGKAPRGRVDLGDADDVGVEQNLALQIGQIHAVRIDQRQRPHTGCRQKLRDRVAEAADADDKRVGAREVLLRVDTELGQQNVTAVAQQLGVVHLHSLL